MSCIISGGTSRTCSFEVSGIKNLWIANATDVTSITDSGSGVLDTITMDGSTTFYSIDLAKNSANYTEELQVNGSQRYLTQTLLVELQANSEPSSSADGTQSDVDLQGLLDIYSEILLAESVAVVETRSGKRFVLGYPNALESTAGSFTTGQAEGDPNVLSFTLTSEQVEGSQVFSNSGTIPV